MATKKKSRVVLARAADLPPGQRLIVDVNGHGIGIFNVGGAYYAVLNRCPHRAGPLCLGRVRPLVVAAGIGRLEYAREGEILKCPWHQWEFDIRTGQALYDEKLRVRTYEVTQEGDDVVLYL